MKETQLTTAAKGHFLNNLQCFSPDGEWLVYDTRNDDAHIARTGSIEMVNMATAEVKLLYQTSNQTEYGPGVGAAVYSPIAHRVVFIQGIRNADQNNPYSFTRRTGIAVDLNTPSHSAFMDARNIYKPYTKGALRGGTHAHSWSGDGQCLSFTYNDEVIAQLSLLKPEIQDLRTVGIMFPGRVEVPEDPQGENNPGEMYAVLIAEVTENPVPGTDDISKAFDECWVGTTGYQRTDGSWQSRAIAFQGNVKDIDGQTKTEVFIADLPEELFKMRAAGNWEGMSECRLPVPKEINQRRLTFTENGVQGPRHWLRASPDGNQIAFLSSDASGFINVFAISPNGGVVKQLSFHQFNIQSGINFSPDGLFLAYIAENAIYKTEINTGISHKLTAPASEAAKPVGSINWSPDGKHLAYNRYINNYLQIFILEL